MKIPVYINSFNRLSYLEGILKELERFDALGPITVVDQASTYPPLQEWLSQRKDFRLIRMRENHGPRGVFAGLERHNFGCPFYIVSDPDLDFSQCPADLIPRLVGVMQANPEIVKAGPSIRLDDIPTSVPFYDRIMLDEGVHYREWFSPEWWKAAIDTTFAIYRFGEPFLYSPALRAAAPYHVRHLPYYHVPANLTDEDRWYIENLPAKHKGALYFSTMQQDSKHLLGM